MRCWFFTILVLTANVLGENPPALRPAPAGRSSGILNSSPSVLDARPREPGNWSRLQDSIDRSTGRIADESLYQTERLQQQRDARFGRLTPRSEFDRSQEERDRRLRLEAQARRQELDRKQIRQELDRREYELFLNSSSSRLTAQVAADEKTLREASVKRDAQILEAGEARTNALKQNPANAAQIEADYQKRVEQVRVEYDALRQQILGFPPAPATAPSTAPVE